MSVSADCPKCGEPVTLQEMHFFDPVPVALPLPLQCPSCGVRSLFTVRPAGVGADGPAAESMERNTTGTFRRLK